MSCGIKSLPYDLSLPVLQQSAPDFFPFLLQSVTGGQDTSRYSILFACPQQALVLDATGQLEIPRDLQPLLNENHPDEFLPALDSWWRALKTPAVDTEPELPFSGGWFLYLGYELAAEIEPVLDLPAFAENFPVAFAVRIPVAIIQDHKLQRCSLVYESGFEQQAAETENKMHSAADHSSSEKKVKPVDIQEENPQRYLDSVEKIRRYIRDGDVFQVNLSRLWRIVGEAFSTSDQIYDRLCSTNPAPFAAMLHWHDQAVASSSPERLVECRNRKIQTRPIAGTRPRADQVSEDEALSRELLRHPKERAEHIMLIDLERNDLGRVCKPGSIRVDALMTLESYAHVHHIVSNVSGELRDEVTPGEVIHAVFPGGTITGCPKVRCMEIIAELENQGRGPYTGSAGYLDRNGNMDLNILIRTLFVTPQEVIFRAGAGIVHDSVAQMELQETRAKAKGLLKVFEQTDQPV